ncbi:MAG TPA: class I SAM-dependent methyltransferase [Acidimicrobiales bacterium]|jgi:SAM-dependent methyltransferase|nr:class I SAM-dependent methyltransferase [Acidimicrobiales bacterium]
MNSEHRRLLSSEYWYETIRDTVMPFALATVDLGDDVLELGPGLGTTTDLLRRQVRSVTAVEPDIQLADDLSLRLAGTNVEVLHGDVPPLPFGDRRFTGATSILILHHVPTEEMQDRLFAEVARVLRPGGAFVAFDSNGSEELAAFHGHDVYLPIDPDTLEARLLGAGFVSTRLRTIPYGWAVEAITAS